MEKKKTIVQEKKNKERTKEKKKKKRKNKKTHLNIWFGLGQLIWVHSKMAKPTSTIDGWGWRSQIQGSPNTHNGFTLEFENNQYNKYIYFRLRLGFLTPKGAFTLAVKDSSITSPLTPS